MIKRFAYLALFLLFTFSLGAQEQGFVPNTGQWIGDFDFRLRDQQGLVYLRADEQRVALIRPGSGDEEHHHQHSDDWKAHVYAVKWLGANPQAPYSTRILSGSPKLNYLLGSHPEKWRSGLEQYREVVYHDLYPNIDLRYYLSAAGVCAFDFIVHPGGQPQLIKWEIEGADEQGLLADDLVLITSVGSAVYSAPRTFQNDREISSSFKKDARGVYSFDIPNFNPEEKLIIDPTLVFSTYSGSLDDNFGFSATYAEDGSAYGAGITYAYGTLHRAYPTTTGALQDSSQGGMVDIAISKYSADGTQQIYGTYLGGMSNELPFSLLEGPNKSLIVLGVTGSTDFPMHPNGYDTSFAEGPSNSVYVGGNMSFAQSADAFICILDSVGGSLVGSTFLGDTMLDGANKRMLFNYGDAARGDITLDKFGNIIIAANTLSSNLPTGVAINSQYQGGQDGLVASFSTDLQQLNWATYLGGSDDDVCFSIRYTNTERLYAAGATDSDSVNFDTNGVYQAFNRGKADAFLSEIDPDNGDVLAWTFTGTPEEDRAFFVDYTPEGNLLLFGQNDGYWPWVGDSLWGVDSSSQFLQEFSPDLKQVRRSTTFGDGKLGVNDLSPTALMISDCGDVFISGWGGGYQGAPGNSNRVVNGDTRGLPVTFDAYRDSSDNGDFYFLRMDASWKRLEYATFFGQWNAGRDHVDGGSSRFRRDGSIFQAVCSCGSRAGFPISDNAFSDTNRSLNCNLAVFRFDMEADSIRSDVQIAPGYSDSTCLPVQIKFADYSFNADFVLVRQPDGQIDTLRNQAFTISDSGLSRFRFYALDTNCNLIDSNEVSVFGFNRPLTAAFNYQYDSCDGDGEVQFLNLSEGATQYTWLFGDGTSSLDSEPSHSYLPGNYTIQLIAEDTICALSDTLEREIEVNYRSRETGLVSFSDACDPQRQLQARADLSGISPRDFQRFEWYVDNQLVGAGDSLNYNFSTGGLHELKLRFIDTICNRQRDESRQIFFYDENFEIEFPNVFSPNGDGVNDEFNMLHIEAISPYLATAYIEIYNRHGLRLFAADLLEQSWKGQSQGANLPEGVYFYVFNYEDICGKVRDSKGFLHLQR